MTNRDVPTLVAMDLATENRELKEQLLQARVLIAIESLVTLALLILILIIVAPMK